MTKQVSGPASDSSNWVADFFRDADKLELPLLMRWFGDDIDLRIANMPPIRGRAAVEETFRQFWSNFTKMSHKREEFVSDGNNAAQLAIVTYTRHDGKIVPLPVASHLRRKSDGHLDRLWIYIDIAPLFATGENA